jgi:hypothetical protein
MAGFYNVMIGYFFGFALGVGCALAVMYTIYTNGYKRGVADSLLEEKPKRYNEAMLIARKRIEKERAANTLRSPD